MEVIKALLVDDEPRARMVLRRLIEKSHEEIEICGEYGNLLDAVAAIKELSPHVVFLDIQMPQYAGYEIVNFFDTIDFEIVFVTAYDEYAIQAFEMNAMDYVIKPIERDRLSLTIDKLVKQHQLKRQTVEFELLLQSMRNRKSDKLIIPEVGDRRIVEIAAIKAIEANGSYTIFHLNSGENFVVSKNLKYFEERLKNDSRFFRTHRTYIINTEYIERLNKKELTVVLHDMMKVKIARGRIPEFEKLMV